MQSNLKPDKHYDMVILGAGLAGLSLCRQLLLSGYDGKILLVDNRADLPGRKQKVGESLVQLAGYYFTRILDLEEHLLQEHYPKYNLRFHWKVEGRDHRSLEDYACSYIGKTSNIATYQLNRNSIEKHLLQVNLASPRVSLCAPVAALKPELSGEGPHRLQFRLKGKEHSVEAGWLVDTTGRGQLVKRKAMLAMDSPIRHGSSWCWVEGLVNIEKLTDLSTGEIRRRRDREKQGLFPMWLATNHFCGEGFWFWVIPLKGLTSLGVVYDSSLFPAERVSSAEKLIEWVCEEFPLFQRDLPGRKILDSARLTDYAYDCRQTISASRWAMSGMSGRFSDPLYSPGSDLIGIYNSVIVDAVLENDPAVLKMKAELYEPLMRVVYDAYVPSYHVSYDVLGDQEVFTLKYAWELAVYFSFYAFPFVNDLFTDPKFIRTFFRKFALLGPVNRNLQKYLSDYYQWKKQSGCVGLPVSNDFLEVTPLKMMESTYYRIGFSTAEAEEALDEYLKILKEFARFIVASVSSVVLDKREVLTNRSFVAGIKLGTLAFDPAGLREAYRMHERCREAYEWSFDPTVLDKFHLAQPGSEAVLAGAQRG